MYFMNNFGQEQVKDILFFKFNCNYITVKKNHENNHHFIFKNEELVTSAYYNKIIKEDFFYFGQSGPPILYSFKPRRIFKLKKYLKKRPYIFRDESTKLLDAYKIMKYFDRFSVFFLIDNKFVKVVAIPTLGE